VLDFQSRTYICCSRVSSPRLLRSRMPYVDTGNTGFMIVRTFIVGLMGLVFTFIAA
jgi:hypothetical protein